MSRKPLNSRVSGSSSNSLNFYSTPVPRASSFTKTKSITHNKGKSVGSALNPPVHAVPQSVEQPKQPLPDYCSNAKTKASLKATDVEANKGVTKKRTGPKKRPSLSEQLASIGNSVADLTGEKVRTETSENELSVTALLQP
jgi:hypothetical protein